MTKEKVDAEMSRIEEQSRHEVIREYAEGKGVFAQFHKANTNNAEEQTNQDREA